jgi:hypothetical protein
MMILEIFKVGNHTSANGITKDYTLDHLNQIITNHSEPTPIVVGHPKDNSPAFGWIKSLFLKGESLFAEASDIVPEFLDLLKQKIYKNRSVSLKQSNDGTLSLNHVGFLGGTLPAVKGLEALNLNDDDKESISFEFSEITIEEGESTKDKSSQNTQDEKDFSEEFSKLKIIVSDLSTQFNEAIKNSLDTSAFKTKIDELNLKLDSAYFQRSVQDKLNYSSLTPAIQTKITKLLGYFESLDFSEEQNTKVVSDFQELVDLIQPFQTDEVLKKVEFDKSVAENNLNNEFSEMNIDKDSLKLFNEATQYAKENDISFTDAINILINKNSKA